MLPSQALAQGIRVIPHQSRGVFFEWSGSKLSAACAIGTACVGAGFAPDRKEVLPKPSVLEQAFGAGVLSQSVANPVNGVCDHLELVLQRLNDVHQWTRERIVQWLKDIGL